MIRLITTSALSFTLAVHAWAESPATKPLPTSTVYHFTDLQPMSTSLYPTSTPNVLRYYFQLRNQRGSHFIVYEEDSNTATVKEYQALHDAARIGNPTCTIDLTCSFKPFWTNECKSIYYQISNVASSAGSPDRD